MFLSVVLYSIVCFAASSSVNIPLNFSLLGTFPYDGIGALSGGGGVTRLLVDYPENIQGDILDILFKPYAGASLQLIKVEIGGDTQSTEGTELSHMHTRGDLNCSRGYEWWILAEAKKRNPAIRTYGLAWGVPGWIGDLGNAQNPGVYYSQDNIDYHLRWLDCAYNTWGLEIDYMGIWNERGADVEWTIALRNAMDDSGYKNTKIVSADTSWEPVTTDISQNPLYASAVDVIGAHYPGAPPPLAYTLNKTLFASEMWNLGYVDDWNGALILSQDLANQAQWGLSASILWCLVFSWYAPLPFSTVIPGTNAGAGHSILTAAEPWSGNYQLNPQIYAMAHHTQFAKPGWVHMPRGSPGMSALPGGGALVTRFNPSNTTEFSITLHTSGAKEPQEVVFSLPVQPPHAAPPLHVWFTNESTPFTYFGSIFDGGGGVYGTITLLPGAFYTLTSTAWNQGGPKPSTPIPPSSPFPFPYSDNFAGYKEGGYAKYFCDEGGAFVVKNVPAHFIAASGSGISNTTTTNALFQLVTKVPIVWEKNPDPYSLIGNFNEGGWVDYTVSVDAAIDPSAMPDPPSAQTLAAFMNTCSVVGPSSSQSFTTLVNATNGALASSHYPGFCLGTTGSTLYPGADDVGLVPCNSDAASKWFYDSNTREVHMTPGLAGGGAMCLDVLGSNTSIGTRVIAYPCKSLPALSPMDSNQRWTPISSTNAISSDLNSPPLCLDFKAIPAVPTEKPYVMVSMRIAKYERNGPPPSGYTLRLEASVNTTAPAAWSLNFASTVLASGETPHPILPGVFYSLSVTAKGNNISATLSNTLLASIIDSSSGYGMAALGSGWHEAWFDNFAVV